MQNRYKRITFGSPEWEEILKHQYQGYYWYSDASTPEQIEDAPIVADKFSDMPFVVEANFYCVAQAWSIQIKNIDGNYQVAKMDLSGLDLESEGTADYDVIDYFAHRIADYSHYRVVEAWRVVDLDVRTSETGNKPSSPETMTTLEPAWTAFCGFKNR